MTDYKPSMFLSSLLSRRRQSRHMIYATLTSTSITSSGRSILSHCNFYSQANLSTSFDHSTPFIICSSPSKPECSSYETLKELHSRFIKTRPSSTASRPNSSKKIHEDRNRVCEQRDLPPALRKVMGSCWNGSESVSRLGYIENHSETELGLFDSDSGYERYHYSIKPNQKIEPRDFEHAHLVSQDFIHQHSTSVSDNKTWESAEIRWPAPSGEAYTKFVQLDNPLQTFTELEFDPKPIRENIEPLLFAMSPLWSETEWSELRSEGLEEDSGQESEDWSEDEDEDEVQSNTRLAPIDIPGTKPSSPTNVSKKTNFASDQHISVSSDLCSV
ncbi:hypothetical protein CROQUDRAFT_382871 [Cronartium quercuum f. sp. fusiforme G11]|uniref:Uncharacterized protein n=1 Tax=Cronartium quercuum f. sp. fusiforme G11 TaxID=708437 RepID=A0A9P6N707_9BASI|nr:hypothetical protein CROQUDRAFT_382871 [Cronartium quercuum f. sp. fusiforme G11]